MLTHPPPVEVGAVVVGALSGGMHAVNRKSDAIGTFTIALATGLGGGMLRDVLLADGPPLALRAPLYLPVVAAAAVAALLFASWLARIALLLSVLDALLLGLWTVMGAERAFAHGLPVGSVIFLGTITAIGGGVLRDLLSDTVPAVLRRGELHATAALIAAAVFSFLVRFGRAPLFAAEVAALIVAAALRLLAMRWHLTAPEPFDLPAWWRNRRRAARP